MDLLKSRIGVYLAPTVAVWSGTVSSYNSSTFVLTVTTSTGALSSIYAGMAVLIGTRYIRVRSVNAGGNTITLAENPVSLSGGESLTVYPQLFPFPRYQRIDSGGTIYKDYDVSYPVDANATMPPAACCTPEVIIAAIAENTAVSAGDSAGIAPSSTPLTYAWDAGVDGVVTGSGSDVTVLWSTSGFRYLKLTVTDAHGTESLRYIPAWIGLDAFEDVSTARLTYRDGGYEAEIEVAVPPSYAQRSPVAIVDLDTDEVLFFGWMLAQTLRYDFEAEMLRFDAAGAWHYLNRIYSYPFVLMKEASPDEWSEILDLDLRRALWVLLTWHSTLPQLVNIELPETRAIEGQVFQAGTLRSQAAEVLRAAFWEAFSARAGGITIDANPQYEADWSGYSETELASSEVIGDISRERSLSEISEARLSGVYYDSGWVPLIVRAPIHPEDLGNPVELTSLAPASASELRQWAGRHIALAKALRYDVETTVALDPVSDRIVELPDGTQIALEEMDLVHDRDTLSWSLVISGRTFDDAPATADEDPPPEIVIPEPEYPPIVPPIWEPIPEEEWPSAMYVGTWNGGVYYTDDFPEPTEVTQPTWTAVNDGLTSLNLQCIAIDPGNTNYLYALTRDTYEVFRRVGAGSWESLITYAEMKALAGADFQNGTSQPVWITVDAAGGGSVYVYWSGGFYTQAQGFLSSGDHGDTWSFNKVQDPGFFYGSGNIYVHGSVIWFPYNVGTGGYGYVAYTADGGASWKVSANLGWSAWSPFVRTSPLSLGQAMVWGVGIWDSNLHNVSSGTNPMAITAKQAALALGNSAPDALWISQESWSYQRVLHADKIYTTLDGWSNLQDASPASLSESANLLIAPMAGNEDWLILGRSPGLAMGVSHMIYTLESDIDTALVGRAGSSPGSAPYTDSIPATAGPMCYQGVQIIG